MTTLQEDLERLREGHAKTAAPIAQPTRPSVDRRTAYAQIVDVARAAGLDFVRTTALLLKYESENQREDGTAESMNGRTLLGKWPTRLLYEALRTVFEEETLGSIDRLSVLLTELSILGLDQAPTDSDAVVFFARQHCLTHQQASSADPATRRRYDSGKDVWLTRNAELGELSLAREDLVLRMECLRQEFMQMFAVEFLAERSQLARLELARMVRKLLEERPNLTADEIEERLRREFAKRQEALAAYELSAAYGLEPGAAVRDDAAPQDLAEAKHLLRQLAMLIHPDRLSQLPLTQQQKQQLARIWNDTQRLRARSGASGLLCRSNEMLRRNVRLARQILEMAGIEDLDPTATIRGSTLQERIEWLDDACEALEQRIASIQAELAVLSSDQELAYMRALLNAPEAVQEEERATMAANAEQYGKEAEEIEGSTKMLLAASG